MRPSARLSNFFVEPGEDSPYGADMNDIEILDAIRDGRSRAWLARALGVPYHACYAWYRRGRIPRRHRAAVMALASARGARPA